MAAAFTNVVMRKGAVVTRKWVEEGIPTQANNHCAREDKLFVEHPRTSHCMVYG